MVKAFTLMELVVALIIGAILTGIILYSYLLFTRQFRLYRVQSNTMNEYLLLTRSLNHDVEAYDFIQDSSRTIIFTNVHGTPPATTYSFTDKQVIRLNENGNDTFHIPVAEYKFDNKSDSIPLVERMSLILNMDGGYMKPVFTKHYSAKQLLWFENLNVQHE